MAACTCVCEAAIPRTCRPGYAAVNPSRLSDSRNRYWDTAPPRLSAQKSDRYQRCDCLLGNCFINVYAKKKTARSNDTICARSARLCDNRDMSGERTGAHICIDCLKKRESTFPYLCWRFEWVPVNGNRIVRDFLYAAHQTDAVLCVCNKTWFWNSQIMPRIMR